MLIISKKTPTTSRRCLSLAEALLVVRALVEKSVSFYCEPEPDDHYLIFVNEDAWSVIDDIMCCMRVMTPLEERLAQAQRTFNQNPTPALSTVIKRLAAAVKRERKKAL